MSDRIILIFAICVASLALTVHADDGPTMSGGVLNGDFTWGDDPRQSGWMGWSWGDRASFSFSDQVKESGRSVKVTYPDIEGRGIWDWQLTNEGRMDVKPGEVWTATAWVKYEDTERIALDVRGVTAEGRRYRISGMDTVHGTGDWRQLETTVTVPEGCEQVFVQFTGAGKTRGWISDVQFRKGGPERTAPTKPEVEGWAYGSDPVRETLGRGVVAMPRESDDIYIRWRLLEEDGDDVAFNVYRVANGQSAERLNDEPVVLTTDFVDTTADLSATNEYFVRAIVDGEPLEPSDRFVVAADAPVRPYLSIPLDREDTTFSMVGVGDLNGDGRYDFVIKTPASSIDPYENYWRPSETTYTLEAYLSDGTFLWRRDLGPNIEAGIWYSPYIVHDFNGDGRAEVAVKTAPVDEDFRETEPDIHGLYAPGRVYSGPEYLSVLDGMTGEEIARADWPSREGMGAYNLASRNQIGVAYLDGKTPCIIVARGTYAEMKAEAFQLHDGELEQLWTWHSSEEPGGRYYGQGDHYMHTVDLDGDGRESVVLGSAVLNPNGTGRWSTGLGHVDNVWVGNIDPTRLGLEIYYGVEISQPRNGVCLVDASTGEILWGLDQPTDHVHSSGLVSNIDPRYVGMEGYSGEQSYPARWLHTAQGKLIADETTFDVGLAPRAVYWDATPEREVVTRSRIFKFPTMTTLVDNIEGRQAAWLDLFGDWREEIITSVPGELRIYLTPVPARDRRVTLLQDRLYRNGVAHLSMGYSQPPLTSYYIGRDEPLRHTETSP